MATADAMSLSGTCTVPSHFVTDFVERAMIVAGDVFHTRSYGRGSAAERRTVRWLEPTVGAICRLPWEEGDLPGGERALQTEAVTDLLWLLVNVLEDDTMPPTSVVPTWRGGVVAEWHVDGFDLEIESDPGGSIEYSFCNPASSEEYDGPVEGKIDQLKEHVRLLPHDRK